MINLLLFIVAWVLLFPLTLINFFYLVFQKNAKGYFYQTAMNIDKFGNREFRAILNATLRKPHGYMFGDERETISSALGKNKRDGTLSPIGKTLDWVLDRFDKNHSLKYINELPPRETE